MEEHKIVQHNLSLQREWYGETLGDRVRRLLVAFDVSQAQLADVLGISAPMLSQVMSGRRAKIGNPSVFARLVMLERKVLTQDVASGDAAASRRALDDVRNSRPTVGPDTLTVNDGRVDRAAAVELRRVAEPHELAAAAELIAPRFPAIAGLLRRAARER